MRDMGLTDTSHMYKTDKQQGPTVWLREVYRDPVTTSDGKLSETDCASVCITGSLCGASATSQINCTSIESCFDNKGIPGSFPLFLILEYFCHLHIFSSFLLEFTCGLSISTYFFARAKLSVKVLSCSVMSDSLPSSELLPSSLLCLWDFPGKNTRVGCHFLLQEILPTQGNLSLVPMLFVGPFFHFQAF